MNKIYIFLFIILYKLNAYVNLKINMVLIMNEDRRSLTYRYKLEPAIDIAIEYFNDLNSNKNVTLVKNTVIYSYEENDGSVFMLSLNEEIHKAINKKMTKDDKRDRGFIGWNDAGDEIVEIQNIRSRELLNSSMESSHLPADTIISIKNISNLKTPQPSFQVIDENKFCSPELAIGGFADIYKRVNIDFIIGPSCTNDMRVIAPVAGYFGLPICTGYSIYRDFDAKYYSTLTRLSFRGQDQVKAVDALLQVFGHWEVTIITDIKWSRAAEFASNLGAILKSNKMYIRVHGLFLDSNQEKSLKPLIIMEKVRSIGKAAIFLTDNKKMKKLLLAAHKLGMGNGQFLFIAVELYPGSPIPHFLWVKGKKEDEIAKDVYTTLLVVGLKLWKNEKWQSFSYEVKKRALEYYNYSFTSPVNYFIGAFYDCVIMYAYTLYQSKSITSNHFWNKSFKGVTGDIYLDEFGNRRNQFTIYGMTNRYNGMFEEIALFDSYIEKIIFSPPRNNVHWILSKAPPIGNPICKYYDTETNSEQLRRCSASKMKLVNTKSISLIITFITLGCILIIFLFMFGILYLFKKQNENIYFKYKKWKICWNEIEFKNELIENVSSITFNSNQFYFSSIGVYQNNLVFLLKIPLDEEKFEINAKFLSEVRFIRDISHENLTVFMGISFNNIKNEIALVTRLVSKLNLIELLAKEKLELDLILQYSIINDIIKGMSYIHNSPIGYHGRLTSANILIDNRFSAKIAGFGLPTLYETYLKHELNSLTDISKYLVQYLPWCAPEHLRRIMPIINTKNDKRTHQNNHKLQTSMLENSHLKLSSTTKEADIYSFAIILSEIITRKPPFYYNFVIKEQKMGRNANRDKVIKPFDVFLIPLKRNKIDPLTDYMWKNTPYVKFLKRVLMEKVRNLRRPAFRPIIDVNLYNEVSKCMKMCNNEKSQAVGKLSEPDSLLTPVNQLTSLKKRRISSNSVDLAEVPTKATFQATPEALGLILPNLTIDKKTAAIDEYNNKRSTVFPQCRINNKKIRVLIEMCWDENPLNRPSFQSIGEIFKNLTKRINFHNMIDSLLERLEEYTITLEQTVRRKTKQFSVEKKRVDRYLFEILPKPIALELKMGHKIMPEEFQNVTIYFSDIVNFTILSASSTPIEIVDFLNDLYCCFDYIAGKLDVYKVETIGDAYMVVSGLPKRNGNKHVREISRFALTIRDNISQFNIKHRPNDKLQIRIGLHTGPCAAGIVGLKMPRYCLFGDTIITASQMESQGEAMKIHISENTKKALLDFPTFRVEERGCSINIKGKGSIRTYWLIEEIICNLI